MRDYIGAIAIGALLVLMGVWWSGYLIGFDEGVRAVSRPPRAADAEEANRHAE